MTSTVAYYYNLTDLHKHLILTIIRDCANLWAWFSVKGGVAKLFRALRAQSSNLAPPFYKSWIRPCYLAKFSHLCTYQHYALLPPVWANRDLTFSKN